MELGVSEELRSQTWPRTVTWPTSRPWAMLTTSPLILGIAKTLAESRHHSHATSLLSKAPTDVPANKRSKKITISVQRPSTTSTALKHYFSRFNPLNHDSRSSPGTSSAKPNISEQDQLRHSELVRTRSHGVWYNLDIEDR